MGSPLSVRLFLLILLPLGRAGPFSSSSSSEEGLRPAILTKFGAAAFDGTKFRGRPVLNVQGSVQLGPGVKGKALLVHQVGNFGVKADGVRNIRCPSRCPYNQRRCRKGFTIAFWAKMDESEEPARCSALFSVGNSMVAITPGSLQSPIVINIVINDAIAFCFLRPEEAARITGKWTHFAFVATGSNPNVSPAFMYLNGTKFDISFPRCFPFVYPQTTKRSMYVACRESPSSIDGDCGFSGEVDEFKVFKRILTDKELRRISRFPANFQPEKEEEEEEEEEEEKPKKKKVPTATLR